MVKSTIGAVLACLYVAVSVWLVRSEGQSYRNSLKQARPTAAITDNPVREHTAVAVELPKVDVAPPRAPEPQPAERRDKVAAAPARHPHRPPRPLAPGPACPWRLSRNWSHPPPLVAMLKPDTLGHPKSSSLISTRTGASQNSRRTESLSNLSDEDEIASVKICTI